ncbi:PhzF family phenazine biosynthesis protein [Allocatelliglobosispora scoriae]|uniref:PhzF family phenazine biosynthesis protein n=1 Tax=Allocatelliglobosispora scoriae TaxID=643052 RepID=A0A841BRA0_9ACTN|nr:PhzF family phenazine biosynthesis isomerase [Allocatelliglobosispora scoriae]MBB5869719.1 PhzF family phenazine biosynthesis protein [Allocatelliglobosispora scoriae]
MTEVLRYSAFATDPDAGNPAGIVLDAEALTADEMLAIAAEVGYSETAFLSPLPGDDRRYAVRYFSPQVEVPFCGHATIASAVAVAERFGPGTLHFETKAGLIVIETSLDGDGQPTATLTSVPTSVSPIAGADLDALLDALGWAPDDLDPALPPMVGYAGAFHPVLAAGTRERLAALDYDFDALRDLMLSRDWTTIALVWRESATTFHVRNPFPVGGVVEDPATGAAAAAFGGYLRSLELVDPPVTLTLHQGEDLGRPGLLTVGIPADADTVRVTGNAVAMPA